MRVALPPLRRVLCVAALGAAASAAVACRADEPMRWKLTADQALDFEMSQDMDMNVDAGPAGKLATTAEQTMNLSWNVKSVDEAGAAVIEQKIERVRMKMAGPGGQGFDYDSQSEEPATGLAAMIAPTLKAMTAGAVTFTMSPRGEVGEVTISDELTTALKNGPGGGAGSAEQFKSMVSQVCFQLPENPPKPGEEWATKIEVNTPAGGKQTIETTYRYEGTRDADGTTYAVIKPSLKLDFAKNPMMEMKVNDQKTDGEVLFDLKAGRLHSESITQTVALDMVAGGNKMPGTIDQKIDVTVSPAKAKAKEAKTSQPTEPAPN